MGKRLGIVLALAWGLSNVALGSEGEFASVYNITTPGAWPGGQITWYYNSANRPSNITDDEILTAMSAAFAEWKRVCQVEGTYGGTTTTPVDPRPTTQYVVGWTDFGSAQFHAKGFHNSTSTAGYRPFTGGGVQLNISNPEFRDLIDGGAILGIMQHEIGHSLALAHSDDPTSIMYANPYNTARYEMMLEGDDIAACADLYGGRGLIMQPDLRNDKSVAGYSVQTAVLSAKPLSATPTSSVAQIDPVAGGPYYFDSHWQNLAIGSRIRRVWVAPSGAIYQRSSDYQTTSSSGFRYSTFPDDGYLFPFAGRWALQTQVDGKLAASVPFEVLRGTVTPVAPFEAAIVGERDASGNINWRVATYGNGTPVKTRVIANGVAATALATRAQVGKNTTEVWMETDRPRYKLDQDDGQPSHSYDVVRRVIFSAASDGTPLPAPIQVAESGAPAAYSAMATVSVDGTGDYGVYLAALVGSRLYFRSPAGWSEAVGPLASARGPAVASVDLLRNFDVRSLPAGTSLYVGYGRSLDEVLAKGQYALIRQF